MSGCGGLRIHLQGAQSRGGSSLKLLNQPWGCLTPSISVSYTTEDEGVACPVDTRLGGSGGTRRACPALSGWSGLHPLAPQLVPRHKPLGSQGWPAHTSAQCEEPAHLQNLASLKHPSPGISRYSPFYSVLSIEPSHSQLSDFNVCKNHSRILFNCRLWPRRSG